jgi:hypothetical protein
MIIAQMVELVDTLVLEASAIVREGSSPFLGTNLVRSVTMRQTTFENIYNKERFVMVGKPEKKFIDGVEFVKLLVEGTRREVFVRRDYVKKVNS